MSTKARIGGIVAVVVVVAGIGLTGAAAKGFGFDPGAVDKPQKVATAKVVKEDLADTQTANGALGFQGEHDLKAQGGVVTWLPAQNDVIALNGTLYRVDNSPVVLLKGTLPMWRPLADGAKGPDVEQLEQNLAALGYTGFDVDQRFTASTAAAVKRWQKAIGAEPTGSVDPRQVVISEGSVRITAVLATLGDTAGDVIRVAQDAKVITVRLDPSAVRFATVGAKVSYALGDGGAGSGTITQVETVVDKQAAGPGGDDQSTKLKVTVAPDDPSHVGTLGDSTVKVTFITDTRPGVLVVPVTALLALSEGGYAVEVVDKAAPKGRKLVGVETGLFSQGKVEVTGSGLREGQAVVVAE